MPKVYLSPAYHWCNACAISGCDETTHNNLYLDELEVFLTACGIDWKRGPRRVPKSSESGDALMMQAVAQSNAWGADVHYVSHTNASGCTVGGGTVRGYRPIIFTGSAGGKKLAAYMIARRHQIYDQPIALKERADLYELRMPTAVSYYEEHVFHDNPADAAWFHAHLRDIARAAAKGLCDYFAIPFVEPYGAAGTGAEDNAQDSTPASGGTTLALPTLRRGDGGESVRALQLLLGGTGHSCGAADGDYGGMTEAAVRRFQRAMAQDVTGAADGDVWRRLLGV